MPKHPNITQWADWVRGASRPPEAATLDAHLDAGCPSCAAAVAALKRVAEAGLTRPPPDYAVRSVQAFFALNRPERRGRWAMLELDLVFDSELADAAPGARHGRGAGRQLLFQSDEYALDVRVSRESGSGAALVVGQLLGRGSRPVERAPAYLVAAGEVAVSTFTGELGGFYMEGRLEPPLELWIFPDSDHRIAVTLEKQARAD